MLWFGQPGPGGWNRKCLCAFPLPSGQHPQLSYGFPQVNEVVFGPGESHCATCGEDGSVRVWALASMELVIQFQVLNQVCGECPGWGWGEGLLAGGLAWVGPLYPPSGLSVGPQDPCEC